jgi:tRNA(Ile)-lysidine synthase TilS/MesJ
VANSKSEPETKRCPRCGETKPVNEFSGWYCKPCRKEYNLIRYGNRKRGHSLEDAFQPRFD